MDIGKLMCHRIPERSFFYKNHQFPVCARCTGVYLSLITAPLLKHLNLTINTLILVGIILLIPMAIDGTTQLFKLRESNNYLRLLTGFLGGIGTISLAFGTKIILMEFFINVLS